ncbi:MAG: cytochrome d ubiquinol oxidase subunit II [Dysgonamonadaceae bacterium]|jgi:cytochrome d ubiquinol oxidase subunit II|nr:cytochrome d ubiquinol oxidase subunit II [Dysgonamonadaceae bacterium]
MDYSFYQHYWWFLISLLGALLVFLLFVQGGQSLIYTLGKKENHLNMMLLSLKMKWELTFTTLVTFGGAFFASFPLFYSTSFGGAYWVWMLILFSFVVQAVSYEFIAKKGGLLGNRTYKAFLFLNGLLGPLLLGAAVSTFFTGSEFVVNKGNITDLAMPVISSWENPLHGLEAVGNIWNVFLGLAVFFLARCLGCLYFINNLDDSEIRKNARKQLLYNAIPFLLFFLLYLGMLLLKDGWAEDPVTKLISSEPEPLKYWHNLLAMPWALAMLVIGVVLVLYGFGRSAFQKKFIYGIWYAGPGVILVVLVLFLIAGFNNTSYYPSLTSTQSSLTITNSCSSLFTLKAMSVVSLFIPFVAAYIWYAWRSLDKKKVKSSDVSEDGY